MPRANRAKFHAVDQPSREPLAVWWANRYASTQPPAGALKTDIVHPYAIPTYAVTAGVANEGAALHNKPNHDGPRRGLRGGRLKGVGADGMGKRLTNNAGAGARANLLKVSRAACRHVQQPMRLLAGCPRRLRRWRR